MVEKDKKDGAEEQEETAEETKEKEEEEEEEEDDTFFERIVLKDGTVVIKLRKKVPGPRSKVKQKVKRVVPKQRSPERLEPRPPLKIIDIVIMWVLWSYEILHVSTRAFKASWLAQQHYKLSTLTRMTNDVEPTTVESLSLMMGTIAITLAVSWFFSNEMISTTKTAGIPSYKGLAMVIGQIVYIGTPFIGFALLQEPGKILNIALVGCQIGWYAVEPIRFSFIFHQILPCEVYISRMTVAFNLFLIGITEYIVSVWVLPTKFDYPSIAFAWSALILCMMLWTGAIIILLPAFNKIPDDEEAVRGHYTGTEVIRYFNQRQTKFNILRFLALIYPCIMFAISKELMNVIIDQYYFAVGTVSRYRLDLAISPLAMIATTAALLLVFGFIRHEVHDLIPMGLAHLLNLVFFILILVFVNQNIKNSDDDIRRQSSLDQVGIALILLRSSNTTGEVFDIAYNDSSGKSIVTPTRTGKPSILIAQMSQDTPKFRSHVQGSADGNPLFSGVITFSFQEINVYAERNGKLYLVRHSIHDLPFDKVIYPNVGYSDELTLTSFAIAPRCYEGPPEDANGFRVFLKGNCHSVKSWIDFMDENRTLQFQQLITPTVQDDGTLEPATIKVPIERTLSYTSLTWVVDNREDWALEIEEPVDPFTYQKYWMIDLEANFTHTFVLSNDVPNGFANPKVLRRKRRRAFITKNCPTKPTTSTTTSTTTPSTTTTVITTTTPPPPWVHSSTTGTTPTDFEAGTEERTRPRTANGKWLLLPAAIVLGFALGMAAASYIHFLWIQSPIRSRLLIISSYFMANFFSSWVIRNVAIGFGLMVGLVVLETVFIFWHFGCSGVYYNKLRRIVNEQHPGYYRRL